MTLSSNTYTMPSELLLDFATGAALEPVALAVATVVDLNPAAASAYQRLNQIGGDLLESLEPATGPDDTLKIILAHLADCPPDTCAEFKPAHHNSAVPLPLRAYVGDSFETLPWNHLTSGVDEFVIKTNQSGYRTSLLRIAPGKAMPHHGHAGEELTVVIEGAYDSECGHFAVGDMEVANPDTKHKPVADTLTGCLCLAVLSAPVQLTGFVGWFINPFLKV